MVRSRGLEPPRVAPLAPQASASTNSATTAVGGRPLAAERLKPDVTNRPPGNKGSPLDQAGQLLRGGPELLRMMGDARSELFHYEVRSTYDTPEVADSRRIVEEAQHQDSFLPDEPEDDEPWRRRRPE